MKARKVVHLNLFKRIPPGVVRQLESEITAAQSLGIDWECVVFSGEAATAPWQRQVSYTGPVGYVLARLQFFAAVLAAQRAGHIVLLRYSLSDPVQALFAIGFTRVVSVHHTFEVEECGAARGCRGHVKRWVEKRLGGYTLSRVSAIVGVTGEIVNYERQRIGRELPTLVVANGIDLASIAVADDRRAGVPKLIFVASRFADWHGLDLLLDSVEKSDAEFELYLVGEVPARERARAGRDPRVVCTGLRSPAEIRELAASCDLGISTLALYRNGMTQAATLKVREYLALGLACWADHEDAGLPADFPFFKRGPADIERMCEFALALRQQSRRAVRERGAPFTDKRGLIKRTADWLGMLHP